VIIFAKYRIAADIPTQVQLSTDSIDVVPVGIPEHITARRGYSRCLVPMHGMTPGIERNDGVGY
jgi:hypothetical protein